MNVTRGSMGTPTSPAQVNISQKKNSKLVMVTLYAALFKAQGRVTQLNLIPERRLPKSFSVPTLRPAEE